MDPAISWLTRAALALLFAASAAHKLRDPAGFAASVRDYRILPRRLATPFAAATMALEAGVALALLAPPLAPTAAAVGAGLLALYSLAVATNLLRGRRHIDCGCLGPAGRQPIGPALLVRNAVLLVAAAVAASPVAPRPLHLVDGLSIAAGVAVAAFLFLAASNLASAPPRLARSRRSS